MASTSGKRKRVVLTLEQKIEICKRLKAGEKRSVLMSDFNIGSSTIYDIISKEEQLMKFVSDAVSNKVIEHRRTLHKPKLNELDAILYEWFQLKRSEGVRITNPMLVEKAKDIYKRLDLKQNCAFSDGWLSRFKIRHGIHRRDISEVTHITEDMIECVLSTKCQEIKRDDKVSWECARASFANITAFAETQDCFTMPELMQLHVLHTKFLQKNAENRS